MSTTSYYNSFSPEELRELERKLARRKSPEQLEAVRAEIARYEREEPHAAAQRMWKSRARRRFQTFWIAVVCSAMLSGAAAQWVYWQATPAPTATHTRPLPAKTGASPRYVTPAQEALEWWARVPFAFIGLALGVGFWLQLRRGVAIFDNIEPRGR